MDENGIKVKNPWNRESVKDVIGWDKVRWLRDGERFSRYTRWSLEIVLQNGSVVRPDAAASRTPAAIPQTLQAIRQAARDHAIPAVFTGRPVERLPQIGILPKTGLYPDPGGEPGLREWNGTEWSPVLLTDLAGTDPGGPGELATTWSPLPKQAQQQHAEAAAAVVENSRSGAGALFVLALVVAVPAVVLLGIACTWLGPAGAGVSGGSKTAAWVTGLFLALCTAGLRRSIRSARRRVERYRRIAGLASHAASQASAQDVESPPEETWVVSGRKDTELRFDIHEITLRTRGHTRWIAWDDVRWFRDGEHFHLSRRLRSDGWALAIVLKDGSVVIPDATRKTRQASRETMLAVRQAARHHAIPAVLTGRPVGVKPDPADKPGLYPDPGGEPGLREWTGTEWLPFLLADTATSGSPGEEGLASIRSPLSGEEQQRQWDAAIAAVPRWYHVAGWEILAMVGSVGVGLIFPPIFVVVRGVQHGYWLGLSPVPAVLLYAAGFLCACVQGVLTLIPVHIRRVTGKVARAARAASARAAAEAAPTA
jgi:hypothetical protein